MHLPYPVPALLWLLFCCSWLPGCQTQPIPQELANQLIDERSPYLLQHAYNPVDWYPWGEVARQKATAEGKLMVVSIGYAACHWCHVMEAESFEDSTVAQLMNEHFVSVKVDREERPDVDQIYMDASLVINGSGGWPLNAIVLPDGRPVYAVTYLPKEQWMTMLQAVLEVWQEDPQRLSDQADLIVQGIRAVDALDFKGSYEGLAPDLYEAQSKAMLATIDFKHGGKQGAPKFPVPVLFEYLLASHFYSADSTRLQAVMITLEEMARGGIFDQVHGGFCRYATDPLWRIPHFEKMLYDNAQLISLYSHAWQVEPKPRYEAVIRASIAFVEQELGAANGGFYSSLNADSEGEEGRFYTWTYKELKDLLGDDLEAFAQVYRISEDGNWEDGRNILYQQPGLSFEVSRQPVILKCIKLLREASERRIKPSLDDKQLTSWNALMLRAYCDAYRALGDEGFRRKALELASFITSELYQPGGGLYRSHQGGTSGISGFLDDYALTASAWLALYEITFDEQWLSAARQLLAYAKTYFKDEQTGLYFYTSSLDDPLVLRKKELTDQVIPSSNAVLASTLYRLGQYDYQKEQLDEALYMVNTMLPEMQSNPGYYAHWAQLVLQMSQPGYEVAIVGERYDQLRAALQASYLPHALFLGGPTEGTLDLLKAKHVPGETYVYVCENKSCKLPVKEPAQALQLLQLP